jgi:proteasome lid subunit RPN8/RPN11
MASLIATLARAAFGPRPKLLCDAAVWNAGVAELHRRTGGRRESGAFLLGSMGKARRIEEFVFYDDIDPDALKTGIVVIDGRRLGDLWTHCRKTGRNVVADVHVHPGGFQQSESDRANPIMAEVGHIAIILPHFAGRATQPGGIGIHEYLGSRRWRDRSHDTPSPFHIGWWPAWR